MEILETDTGDDGRAYVRARLQQTGLTLSSSVISRVDLEDGVVFTWATDPPPTTLLDFQAGSRRLLHGEISEARVLALIRAFFLQEPFGSLWVEEILGKRSDPYWTNPEIPEEDRTRGWFFGEEVYSLAFPGDDDDQVLGALGNAFDWGGGAFLTASANGTRYRTEREIDVSDLSEVASQIRNIICPAYDGMGYLVWRPCESDRSGPWTPGAI